MISARVAKLNKGRLDVLNDRLLALRDRFLNSPPIPGVSGPGPYMLEATPEDEDKIIEFENQSNSIFYSPLFLEEQEKKKQNALEQFTKMADKAYRALESFPASPVKEAFKKELTETLRHIGKATFECLQHYLEYIKDYNTDLCRAMDALKENREPATMAPEIKRDSEANLRERETQTPTPPPAHPSYEPHRAAENFSHRARIEEDTELEEALNLSRRVKEDEDRRREEEILKMSIKTKQEEDLRKETEALRKMHEEDLNREQEELNIALQLSLMSAAVETPAVAPAAPSPTLLERSAALDSVDRAKENAPLEFGKSLLDESFEEYKRFIEQQLRELESFLKEIKCDNLEDFVQIKKESQEIMETARKSHDISILSGLLKQVADLSQECHLKAKIKNVGTEPPHSPIRFFRPDPGSATPKASRTPSP